MFPEGHKRKKFFSYLVYYLSTLLDFKKLRVVAPFFGLRLSIFLSISPSFSKHIFFIVLNSKLTAIFAPLGREEKKKTGDFIFLSP